MQKWCRRGKSYSDDPDFEDATYRTKVIKNLKILGRGTSGALKNNVQQILERQKTGEVSLLDGKSLNLFDIDSRFRQIIHHFVCHKYFDYGVILVIILSSIELALDTPLEDPDSNFKITLFWIDVGTTIIFLIEAIVKTIAFGFVFNG